ncbi:hypothetical protein VK792_07235 [Mesobacterium sp. TK19101]|uniref:Uncharacterized protein n=1 Tax=Mesobacterium hydrothermale TaxID=3111907 RepID=A0ABU6HF33_9RHOB|nr:hypothetical protein [Mesobacterium sp. TK19101]MEC3861075.1 hypothetical protein [Mesobacterium sp. TK19101]
MVFTIILSVLAGWAARPLQAQVVELLLRVMDEDHMPDRDGQAVAAFALVMMLAALVLEFAGGSASPLLVLVGGFLGYFQAELREALLSRRR